MARVDDKVSFMEHLGELRTRIMRSLYCPARRSQLRSWSDLLESEQSKWFVQ